MDKFKVGDFVWVNYYGARLTGTVITVDEKRAKYLVRLDATRQDYFAESDIEAYEKTK